MRQQARTPAAPLELRLARWRTSLAGIGMGLAAATVSAQTTPIQGTGQAYVDKVIEGLPDLDGGIQLKSSEYNEAGWPRSWRVDYSLFRQTGGGDTTARALGLGGFVDTPNYGALSINANLVQQSSNAPATRPEAAAAPGALTSARLPLDGGWFANHNARRHQHRQHPARPRYGAGIGAGDTDPGCWRTVVFERRRRSERGRGPHRPVQRTGRHRIPDLRRQHQVRRRAISPAHR
jgi:hypothetical protein